MTYYPARVAGEAETAARSSPWRRSRPGSGDPHTSLLFWLTVLGLACVSLLSVAWGASAVLAQKGSEKLLRVEQFFPKLNSVREEWKADWVRTSEHETSELPHPKERTAPPLLPMVHDQPKITTIEPPRHVEEVPASFHLVAPVELAPAEICQDPFIYQQRCTSQPGESPMIRNWKTLTMVSLLSTAAITFAPQPAVVVAEERVKKDKEPVEVKGLDELQASMNKLIDRIDKLEKKKAPAIDQEALTQVIREEIRAELKKAQDAVKSDLAAMQQVQLMHKRDIDRLFDEIGGLHKKLAAMNATPAVDKAFMEEFRGSLKTLNETIAKLAPTKERKMMSPPINGSANQGRLVIVNLYNRELLFIINGANHRVPAGTSKILDVPTGTLRYVVAADGMGILSDQTTTLAAGDTFTLSAANQR